MKLTIIDQKEHPIYLNDDFLQCFKPEEIVILCVPESKSFDGSILQSISTDTTHLIMRVLDKVDEDNLKKLEKLEYIGITSTGWWDQYFDRDALTKRNIVVTNNPTYARESVAEAVFATLLADRRKLFNLSMGEVTVEVPIGTELAGKTMGIGLGRIGGRVAEIAHGFNMLIISNAENKQKNVVNVDRETLLRNSDVISLHIPKSAGVIISKHDFQLLKPTATIINSAGSNLIAIEALVDFLNKNENAVYIDLSYPERELFTKLLSCKNAYLYPLFSNQTQEAYINKKKVPIDNLCKFVLGNKEINRVI